MDFLRGYPIIYINNEWVFEDTKKPTANTWKNRPCGHCKKYNTEEGHDRCLGTLPGVMNACCGHGRKNEAYIQFLNGKSIHGNLAFIILNKLKNKRKEFLEEIK